MTNRSGAIGTRTELLVHVLGIPAPQGSKSFKGMRAGKPILIESSKKVRPWRDAVEAAATAEVKLRGWAPLDGPVEMTVVFWLPAPKSMPKGRTGPTTYPDLSKLVRSTEDALVSAGVVVDDARIVRTTSEKRYANLTEPGSLNLPGALIWIRPAPPSERHGERRNPLAARPSDPPDGSEGISGPREV